MVELTRYDHLMEDQKILELLKNVPDPDVPVLTVADLGIIREVNVISAGKSVEIKITPTYSGCPALDTIAMNIRFTLLKSGYRDVFVTKVLSPPWTTEWMSENG